MAKKQEVDLNTLVEGLPQETADALLDLLDKHEAQEDYASELGRFILELTGVGAAPAVDDMSEGGEVDEFGDATDADDGFADGAEFDPLADDDELTPVAPARVRRAAAEPEFEEPADDGFGDPEDDGFSDPEPAPVRGRRAAAASNVVPLTRGRRAVVADAFEDEDQSEPAPRGRGRVAADFDQVPPRGRRAAAEAPAPRGRRAAAEPEKPARGRRAAVEAEKPARGRRAAAEPEKPARGRPPANAKGGRGAPAKPAPGRGRGR